MNDLRSVEWLNDNFSNENLVVLDASLASTIEGSRSDLDGVVIKNSRYFDLKKKFSDHDSAFPNTLPSPEDFEKECRALGINNSSLIVVYDDLGVYSSPRVWWMFRAMGHQEVYVLDGGLPHWVKNGYPTSSSHHVDLDPGDFTSNLNLDFVKSYQDIVANVDDALFTIIDARSEGRFNGVEDEPRKHLQSGCIPHSINIPYKEVLKDGKFKSESELKAIVDSKKLDLDQVVFSCGSGLTACIVMLALRKINGQLNVLYDGSWTEWAELQGLTKE